MKKTKLSLNDLKVRSFVTTLSSTKTQTVKGGESKNCNPDILSKHTNTITIANVNSSQQNSNTCFSEYDTGD